MAKNESARETNGDAPQSWRELAVARSLDSARTRAENRVQRFLDAALELMNENTASKDFTVQEVVERSGQSLRSFYQYFGGKHELLLALFEESVRSTAESLREKVAAETDPLARLHCFVVEHFRLCRPVRKGKGPKNLPAPVLVEFAQQLLTAHPAEAARAFVPVVALLRELLADAQAAGAIRPELRIDSIAGTILEAVMFNAFSATIGGTPVEPDGVDAAEELWDLFFNGLAASAKPARRR